MGSFIDMTGQRFERLVVLERAPNKGDDVSWKCVCDCGETLVTTGANLRRGKTRSCGCLLIESRRRKGRNGTHHKTNTRLYRIWCNMKNRCYNSNDDVYTYYGERGIYICSEWKNDFICFYTWAIKNGYKEEFQIDRIDNKGPYSPENCRWTDRKTQCQNRRSTRMITFQGKSLCLSDWAKELHISHTTLYNRLKKYPLELALTVTGPSSSRILKNAARSMKGLAQ